MVSGQTHSLGNMVTHLCPHAREDPREVAESWGWDPPPVPGCCNSIWLDVINHLVCGESENPASCPSLRKILSPWPGQWLRAGVRDEEKSTVIRQKLSHEAMHCWASTAWR